MAPKAEQGPSLQHDPHADSKRALVRLRRLSPAPPSTPGLSHSPHSLLWGCRPERTGTGEAEVPFPPKGCPATSTASVRTQSLYWETQVPAPPPLGGVVLPRAGVGLRSLRRGWQGHGQRGVLEQRVPHLHLSRLRRQALDERGKGPQDPVGPPPCTAALTGARPGHSYTVKSPSSFSSSEAESGSLGGSECLLGAGWLDPPTPFRCQGPRLEVGVRRTPAEPGWGRRGPGMGARGGDGRGGVGGASHRSRHRSCCLWCW